MKKNFTIEELKALVQKIFQNYSKLNDSEKSIAVKMFCHGKYSENQIAYIQLPKNLSAGFALTVDSLCIVGSIGNKIFKYKDIVNFDDFKIFVDYEKYKDVFHDFI